MVKINNKKLEHNIGTHRERMGKRRSVQNLRVSDLVVRPGGRWELTVPFVSVSKYNPGVESKKHKEKEIA